MQAILHKLLELPEPSIFDRPMEIYEEFKFTKDDQQALMDIADEKHFELPEYTDEDDEFGEGFTPNHYDVSIHAYRALSRLQDSEHIPFLIQLNDSGVSFDECFLFEDMPPILSQYGAAAIPLLSEALRNQDMTETARCTITAALENLAKQEIEHDRIIHLLSSYLAEKHFTRELNASIINALTNLKAVQEIDLIRSIFSAHLCDITANGDIETVEINLGLRTERETPEGNIYDHETAELHLAIKEKIGPRPADSDPAAVFFHLHALYSRQDTLQDISEIQGYLTGALLAPTPIDPKETFEGIWDDPDHAHRYSPDWANKEDHESYMQTILALHASIEVGLRDGNLEPMLEPSEDESHLIYSRWIGGFSRGISLWIEGAHGDTNATTLLISTVSIITKEIDADTDNTLSDKIVQDDLAQMFADLLHQSYARSHHIKSGTLSTNSLFGGGETYTREEAKISRNSPCLCGSGKKYKRCCLN